MSAPTPNDVRGFLTHYLNGKLIALGRRPLESVPDEYDLLLSGAVDSLGFVEMITATSAHFSREFDLTGLDPEKMTVIGHLCAFISGQFGEHAEEAAAQS
jgi:acyl carrier protein